MTKKAGSERIDIYTRITDRIVEELESGVRPWMKPWSAANTHSRISRPMRHNGLPYSGMNVLLLWSEQVSRGFSSSMWMTFKQALELGGAVRKGETGSTVVFASRFTKSVADGNGNDVDREIPFLKAYSVFNIEQIDGLPDSYYAPPAKVRDPVERIESADLGIAPELEPRPDDASYLQSWLSVLANDTRAIFQAAAHAQRAVSFLHSLQPEAEVKAAA